VQWQPIAACAVRGDLTQHCTRSGDGRFSQGRQEVLDVASLAPTSDWLPPLKIGRHCRALLPASDRACAAREAAHRRLAEIAGSF
jgi:hypothetical protein